MGYRHELADRRIQNTNLLSGVQDLSASGWTKTNVTVAAYSGGLAGAYTITSSSVSGETRITTGITTTQIGPIVFSCAMRAGSLQFVQPRIFDGTLVKQLSDPSYTVQLPLSGVWVPVWVRGYVFTAGNVVYPYIRVGRGDATGTIHVYAPVLEYGEFPSFMDPTTTADSTNDADQTYNLVREDYDVLKFISRTAGDTSTLLYLQLLDSAGEPKDCSGQTMTFRMVDSTGAVVINNRSLVAVDATIGKFTYTFQSSEVATAGEYTAWARRGSALFPGNGSLFRIKLN